MLHTTREQRDGAKTVIKIFNKMENFFAVIENVMVC